LQTPVASDRRLLTALLHINLHLERIADQAVNMAKITKLADRLPQSPKVLQHLEEMGALALGMMGAAMDALARRDLELAHELPRMDDPIDRLNRGMLQRVLEVSEDKQMLEWGIRIYMSCRGRSNGSATTRWTSASRWHSLSPESSAVGCPWRRRGREDPGPCWYAPVRR
jgi:phosphate uptake regulator